MKLGDNGEAFFVQETEEQFVSSMNPELDVPSHSSLYSGNSTGVSLRAVCKSWCYSPGKFESTVTLLSLGSLSKSYVTVWRCQKWIMFLLNTEIPG